MRTMAPLKPENGGNGWSSAVVSVRMKSLVEGTIGNELSDRCRRENAPGRTTDQKVGDSSSSERAEKALLSGAGGLRPQL